MYSTRCPHRLLLPVPYSFPVFSVFLFFLFLFVVNFVIFSLRTTILINLNLNESECFFFVCQCVKHIFWSRVHLGPRTMILISDVMCIIGRGRKRERETDIKIDSGFWFVCHRHQTSLVCPNSRYLTPKSRVLRA